MRNAALAGLLAICLMAGLAIFGATHKVELQKRAVEATVIPPQAPVKIAVTGDIMLGREVGTLMDKNGYDYPLALISPFLKNFDLSVGNFEGTVLEKYNYHDGLKLKFSFSPKSLTQLVNANFGVVSLANNHGFDYGADGFEETKSHLQSEGISPLGHPYDLSKGIVTTVELKGRHVSFLAFNATVPVFDTVKAQDLVAKTKAENPDALIMVLIHWGDEYAPKHNKTQETIGRALIDSGADVILGSHPHVVQDIERYKSKIIFYSQGNFVFDQNFSEATKEGLVLGLELHATSTDIGLFPITIIKSQPALMTKDARIGFFSQLADKSPAELSEQIKSGLLSF